MRRILADFGAVGEETNKLMGYVAAVSRKLEQPLAIVVQSSSAAGKSALMEAVLAFMPEEERVQCSAMTGQSLFYMRETDRRLSRALRAWPDRADRRAWRCPVARGHDRLRSR